jgi:GT2 family glycosyltransferase
VIPVLGVPVLKNHARLQRALDRIDYPVERLVILDQSGIENWRPEKPAMVQSMTVLNFPHAMGVAPSWNIIIKATPFAPWWLFINDDVVPQAGSFKILAEAARNDAVVIPSVARFSFFTIGDEVIKRVGLFDEQFFPMYYEDTEYLFRMQAYNMEVVEIQCPVHHDTSSTIHADGYAEKNSQTFPKLYEYLQRKVGRQDFSEGRWTLETRRANSWD